MMPPQTLKVNKCCLMTSNTMIPGMCVMGKYTLEDVTTKVFVTQANEGSASAYHSTLQSAIPSPM